MGYRESERAGLFIGRERDAAVADINAVIDILCGNAACEAHLYGLTRLKNNGIYRVEFKRAAGAGDRADAYSVLI